MAIEFRGVSVERALRARIAARLMTALARSTTKAGGAQVTFFDENGPKGGPAMRCGITVRLPSRLQVRAEDTAEMWDIWRRLEAVIGGASAPGAGVPDARQALRASLMLEPEFVAMLTPAAAELVSEAQADNVHVAARLRAEEVAGRLAVGPRSWLTSACVFHWNRLGLTTDALRPMVARMLDLLVDGAAT